LKDDFDYENEFETVVDTQFKIGRGSKVIHFPNGGGRIWIENYIDNYQRYFLITNWRPDRCYLLSGNSQALREYQITFKGYEGWGLGIKPYHEWGGGNHGWEIFPLAPAPPVPEPTTYGAIFGTVGLCLATFRRRFRGYRRSLAGRRSDVTSSFPRGAPTASLPKARL